MASRKRPIAARSIPPQFAPFAHALEKLVARAVEGAVDGVLDEVQDKLREIDQRMTSARKRRAPPRVIDVEDDTPRRH